MRTAARGTAVRVPLLLISWAPVDLPLWHGLKGRALRLIRRVANGCARTAIRAPLLLISWAPVDLQPWHGLKAVPYV